MKRSSGTSSVMGRMEPMMPDRQLDRLAELSRSVFVEAGALRAMLPAESTRRAVAVLVRDMNSYYSNLIEGHMTLPRDIECALRNDIATDVKKRQNQSLAVAHVRAETDMEKRLREEPGINVHSEEFLCWLHRSFYAGLPEELQYGRSVAGRVYRVAPGELRDFNVDIGAHTPPDRREIRACLARFSEAYGDSRLPATDSMVAIAASHHRLTWIHPFGDGNGRVARLYSHACLIRQGVDGAGLWTLSRGLARFRSRYYERLAAADRSRHDDYDGRGNLTAVGLADFCVFFLETMLDQVRFMGGLLELPALLARIENAVFREMPHVGRHKESLSRLLCAAARDGEIERGQVPGIVGMKPSAARLVTRLGLQEGLLIATSPKGRLRIAFPGKILDSYFPRLFLDLPYGE